MWVGQKGRKHENLPFPRSHGEIKIRKRSSTAFSHVIQIHNNTYHTRAGIRIPSICVGVKSVWVDPIDLVFDKTWYFYCIGKAKSSTLYILLILGVKFAYQ